MKYLFNLFCFSALLLFSSCKTSFYQIGTLKSPTVSLTDAGEFLYNSDEIDIYYDFWSENGQTNFTVVNKSSKDLTLDLSKSYFVRNGFAKDYYQKRTEVYESGYSRTKVSAYGTNRSISSTYVNSISATEKYQIQYEEKDIVVIPAHTHKIFGEFYVAEGEYKQCGFARNPRHNVKISFTEYNSPIVVENRLMFIVDGIEKPLTNIFYVSDLVNLHEGDAISSETPVICGEVMYNTKYFFPLQSTNRYHVKYDLYDDPSSRRGK